LKLPAAPPWEKRRDEILVGLLWLAAIALLFWALFAFTAVSAPGFDPWASSPFPTRIVFLGHAVV
jgi:hypothetical protein